MSATPERARSRSTERLRLAGGMAAVTGLTALGFQAGYQSGAALYGVATSGLIVLLTTVGTFLSFYALLWFGDKFLGDDDA